MSGRCPPLTDEQKRQIYTEYLDEHSEEIADDAAADYYADQADDRPGRRGPMNR